MVEIKRVGNQCDMGRSSENLSINQSLYEQTSNLPKYWWKPTVLKSTNTNHKIFKKIKEIIKNTKNFKIGLDASTQTLQKYHEFFKRKILFLVF